jgi:hypothetical protein
MAAARPQERRPRTPMVGYCYGEPRRTRYEVVVRLPTLLTRAPDQTPLPATNHRPPRYPKDIRTYIPGHQHSQATAPRHQTPHFFHAIPLLVSPVPHLPLANPACSTNHVQRAQSAKWRTRRLLVTGRGFRPPGGTVGTLLVWLQGLVDMEDRDRCYGGPRFQRPVEGVPGLGKRSQI